MKTELFLHCIKNNDYNFTNYGYGFNQSDHVNVSVFYWCSGDYFCVNNIFRVQHILQMAILCKRPLHGKTMQSLLLRAEFLNGQPRYFGKMFRPRASLWCMDNFKNRLF